MPVLAVPSLPPLTDPAIMVGPGVLTVWALTVSYHRDYGIRQVPLCGKRQTLCDFNRVHGGRGMKLIRWIAQQWGTAVPPLPGSDTQSKNEVLLADAIGIPVPGKTVDGFDIVTVSGEYHYGLRVWPDPKKDTLMGGAAPYQTTKALTVYQLTPANFNNLFVGPVVAPVALGAGGGVLGLP